VIANTINIGEWVLDRENNELRRGSEAARLEPKAIEVLALLAESAGTAVSREDLLAKVWPGVIVGDDALTQAIIKLRKALGDDAHHPKYIETISKRGYRLIAPVGGREKAPQQGDTSLKPSRAILLVVAGTVAAILLTIAIPAGMRNAGMPWPLTSDTRGAVTMSLPVVAVLPLENLGSDRAREYFSDGMTEDIIGALGRFSGVRVMSRSAVQGFKGKAVTPQHIRETLGARYVVQGSVREADGRLRVAVELTDADKGVLLWSERYEGEGVQVFEIQDRIVRSLVGTLQVKLTQFEQQRVFTKPTENLEAYDLLLRARELLVRSDRSGNRQARLMLARALDLAPDYPDALVSMGVAELSRAVFGWIEDPAESVRRAETYANRALASPDQRAHAGAHALLAAIYSNHNRFDDALDHSARALALNPSDARALHRRAAALLWTGKIDEAITHLEMARRFDPNPSAGQANLLAVAYYVSGRYRDALREGDTLLARFPQHDFVHAIRAATLAELGEPEKAAEAANEVRRLNPGFSIQSFGTRFADPKYSSRLHEGLEKAGIR
jgi:adenylate cyclase